MTNSHTDPLDALRRSMLSASTEEELAASRLRLQAAEAQLQQQSATAQAAELRSLGVLPVPPDDPIYQQGQTVLIVPPQAAPEPPSGTTRVIFGMQPARRTPPEESP